MADMRQQRIVNGSDQRSANANREPETSSEPSRVGLSNGTSSRSGAFLASENRNNYSSNTVNGETQQTRAELGARNQPPNQVRGTFSINDHDEATFFQSAKLVRSKSEYDPQRELYVNGTEEHSASSNELRHGWEDQYNSEGYLDLLRSVRHPKRVTSSLPQYRQS